MIYQIRITFGLGNSWFSVMWKYVLGALECEARIDIYACQETAARVLQRLPVRTRWVDRVFSKDMFELEFCSASDEGGGLSSTDVDVLLTYLARDRRVLTYNGQVILFLEESCRTLTRLQGHQVFNTRERSLEYNDRRYDGGCAEVACG